MAIPAYYSLIRRGSSGPDVALVQTWLNGIRDSCTWHAALTVDGTFGANARRPSGSSSFGTASKRTAKWARTPGTCSTPATRPSTASSSPTPHRATERQRGRCVRLVQQKLNTDGERLTTDGKFGASTVAAVKRYQTRHSLTSDGSVGKDTWEKMFPAA